MSGTTTAGSADSPGEHFSNPAGIVVKVDRAYVGDSSNNRVRRVELNDGVTTTLAGPTDGGTASGNFDGPCANALFHGPSALAFDASGKLFVADLGNGSIREITGTDAQIEVSWQAPSGAGPTTAYDVVASSPSGVPGGCHVVGASRCVVGLLSSAQPYDVSVVATNQAGASPAVHLGAPAVPR